MNYQQYLDKVYGCFLGKTVVGTLGAPYEGIKMPQTIPFKPEMINTMLPNDDLDLQILWLDVVERYGTAFTSYDLLERFVNCCDYSPGEYAVMRKNFQRGIYPPLSGKFSNDFYVNGMGCPIRSEIWACLFPDAPEAAADYSERDGIIDHAGDSVYAERFFAALESAAFAEDDLKKLIGIGLSVIPADCKIRRVITDTVGWCAEYTDIKLVLRKLLFRYGHPDCTNLYENIGITVAALLLGNLDLIKTGMDALNCGFDTDCTCATAGAVIGAIRGAKALIEEYKLPDIKFVLGVRSDRRSDSVFDLSEDIARLAVTFHPGLFEGAPQCERTFESHPLPFAFSVDYENDDPTVAPQKPCRAVLRARNDSGERACGKLKIRGLDLDRSFDVDCAPGGTCSFPLEFHAESGILYEKNLIAVDFDGREEWSFGVVGRNVWKVVGPIWKTNPECTTEELLKVPNYRYLMEKVKHDGDPKDVTRAFHLNFAIDPETDYLTEDEIFAITEEGQTRYEVTSFAQREDSFTVSDFCGFRGPAVFYLARELYSDRDMEVCVQLGHSAPVKLFLNGKLLAERKTCDTWDAENVHLRNVPIRKGKNRLVLRLTQVNDDTKFNLIFSQGPTCAEHFVCFGTAL